MSPGPGPLFKSQNILLRKYLCMCTYNTYIYNMYVYIYIYIKVLQQHGSVFKNLENFNFTREITTFSHFECTTFQKKGGAS